eukprot:CAMPEP_0197055446 /NCGR_PEP_ID=MMETSP1384-20130603/65557_1 /TAXON_ID=29189 /ORGANISM="Ammonia sp." /LENGTH=232 /DNA_ID=CAMNT_0042489029 /DNA_START=146 /DNA_END=844 /DNA_ORIENTATION=+
MAAQDLEISSTLSLTEFEQEAESFESTGFEDDTNNFSIDETDSIYESADTDSGNGSSADDDTSLGNSSGDDDTFGDEDTSAEGNSSVDIDTDDEDECTGLSQTACAEAIDDDGDVECGYNADKASCYPVTRRAGNLGSGNFDDGYIAAQEAAAQETSQLYTVVGVLGGVVGALVLVIGGGAYYLYNKKHQKFEIDYGFETEMNETVTGTANGDGDKQGLINQENQSVLTVQD